MVCNIYEKWCVPFSFLCYTKHSVDLKGETNNMERRNAWKTYTAGSVKRTGSDQQTDIKYAWMKERQKENASA